MKMVNLGSKHDINYVPYEKFTKFVGYLNTFFTLKWSNLHQIKIY